MLKPTIQFTDPGDSKPGCDAEAQLIGVVKALTPHHLPLMAQLKLWADVRAMIECIRRDERAKVQAENFRT